MRHSHWICARGRRRSRHFDVEDAIDALANLVTKSLLSADSTGGTVLYRLLEATRVYASERLAASDERRRQHGGTPNIIWP